MKVIGGKDFYDSASQFGIDNDVVFVRNKDAIVDNLDIEWQSADLAPYGYSDLKGNRVARIRSLGYKEAFDGIDVQPYKFIIVGRPYACAEVVVSKPLRKVHYFWSADTFDFFIEEHGYKRDTKNSKTYYLREGDYTNDFFEPKLHFTDYRWLIDNRITIAHNFYEDNKEKWLINPFDLYKFDAIKHFDPFILHQEISMWVGGILPRNPNPIVQITDDKVKSHKHGFDKWSFRRLGKNSR